MRFGTEWIIPNGALWACDSNGIKLDNFHLDLVQNILRFNSSSLVVSKLDNGVQLYGTPATCDRPGQYLIETDRTSGVQICLVLNVEASLSEPISDKVSRMRGLCCFILHG